MGDAEIAFAVSVTRGVVIVNEGSGRRGSESRVLAGVRWGLWPYCLIDNEAGRQVYLAACFMLCTLG